MFTDCLFGASPCVGAGDTKVNEAQALPSEISEYLGRQALKQAAILQCDKYVKGPNECVGALAVSCGQWDYRRLHGGGELCPGSWQMTGREFPRVIACRG